MSCYEGWYRLRFILLDMKMLGVSDENILLNTSEG